MEKNILLEKWEGVVKQNQSCNLYLIDECIDITCDKYFKKRNELRVSNGIEGIKIYNSFLFQNKNIIHKIDDEGRCKCGYSK